MRRVATQNQNQSSSFPHRKITTTSARARVSAHGLALASRRAQLGQNDKHAPHKSSSTAVVYEDKIAAVKREKGKPPIFFQVIASGCTNTHTINQAKQEFSEYFIF